MAGHSQCRGEEGVAVDEVDDVVGGDLRTAATVLVEDLVLEFVAQWSDRYLWFVPMDAAGPEDDGDVTGAACCCHPVGRQVHGCEQQVVRAGRCAVRGTNGDPYGGSR